jgi:hypothetical protein
VSLNIKIDDIESFQKHFVSPMIDAMREEIKPLVRDVSDLKDRVTHLESNQKRAMVGWGVFSAALASVLGYGKTAIYGYLTKKQ